MSQTPELLVVMPVYNEQASLERVVREWFQEVQARTDRFALLVLDDGSRDETPRVLARLQPQLGPRLEVLSRENRGHGQTCLQGYRLACERGIPYVFQVDSDGQCDPQYFATFWRLRDRYDVIYGHRVRRDDGWRRVAASAVLKLTLLAVAQVWCIDANVPYRLMRTAVLPPLLAAMPANFALANVGLAVLLRRTPGVRQARVPIRFRARYGGEPSVTMARFGGKARELVKQLRGVLGNA